MDTLVLKAFHTKVRLENKKKLIMPFYTVGKRGTIKGPKKFDSEAACRKLKEGMAGIGTNEQVITEVIAGHTSAQRQDMKLKYQALFRKDLERELRVELNFTFEQIVIALMKDPQEYILEDIHEAVTTSFFEGLMLKLRKVTSKRGLGPDEYTLLGLLMFPKTRAELMEMKKAYREKYKKYLDKKIATAENLAIDFRRIMLGMIDGKRDESSQLDHDQIFKDVMNLIGSKREEHFHGIMHERSYKHIRQLCEGYMGLKGKPLTSLVEEATTYSQPMKDTYIALLTIIQNESVFYAERLHAAFDGVGTDDDALIRVVVLRSEIDLVDVIRIYEKKFGSSLIKDMAGETSGDYEDILLKLLSIPEEFLGEVEAEEEEKKAGEEGVVVEKDEQKGEGLIEGGGGGEAANKE